MTELDFSDEEQRIVDELNFRDIEPDVEVSGLDEEGKNTTFTIFQNPVIQIRMEAMYDGRHQAKIFGSGNTTDPESASYGSTTIDKITTDNTLELIEWVQDRLDLVLESDFYVVDEFHDDYGDGERLIFRVDERNFIVDSNQLETIDDEHVGNTAYLRCTGISEAPEFGDLVAVYSVDSSDRGQDRTFTYVFEEYAIQIRNVDRRSETFTTHFERFSRTLEDQTVADDFENPRDENVEYHYMSEDMPTEIVAKCI
ncbi:hypothetical protein G3I44_13625 [Halogeometricum borinquense]|uniref:Uncharacterized protein n=1 Tax=Halogeometricum borinquense TaxID=60847 RepID=A0A6C0UKX8_9EURY|nr:hypothetical protein [Halogeometricum borinquense]QIB75233.1 hypothetical protein G3I44_13625 [Halogeometricum borinquense]